MARKISKTVQQRQSARKAAMPEVKKLVKRFGRATISSCLSQLRELDKQAQRLAALRKEVRELARKVR